MLCRFGELIDLIRTCLKSGRVVLSEVPRSERRLCERLFGRKRVVDQSMRSRKSSHLAGRPVRRVEIAKRYTLLAARCAGTVADDAVVLEIVVDLRIFRVNVSLFLAGSLLEINEILSSDDLTGVGVDRHHIKAERVGREFSDLPHELVAIRCRIDAESRLQVLDGRGLLRQIVESGL